MTSSLSPSPIISSNIDTTTTTLNNTNKCTIQSPILYSNNPLYQKMKEFILDLCEQGIGAIESNEQIKIKYGVQAPTLCTIYKWRKEYRGGKGEKQILDNINIPTETMDLQQSQQNGKVIKKEFEKYCAECNREMSSRHYYEFHMLNVHDVLLGTTRATVELLGKMSSTRKQQLIFRCDSCSGVGKDYNNFEELQQHKINEHGEHLRIPALHFKKNNNKNNSSPPGKMKAHPKLARSFTTIGRGRDISLPLPTEGLRRSARIPKPTSAIIHSFFSAKDEIDSDIGGEQRKIKDLNKNDNNNGINRTLQGLKEEEARKDAQMNDCFKGRNWEIKEGNLGTKIFSKFVNKNKNNKNASLLKNSINEQKVSQEEEPFVTILNDGRIEVEETESKKAKNTQEKHQIISPSALEASDSMLMALASAALMEKNASETANNSVNPPTTLQASINNSTFPHSSISINSATYSTSIPLSSKVTTSSKNTINGTSKEKMFLTTKTHKKTKKNVVWNNKGKHAANNKNNNIEQNVSENVSKHTELQEHVDNNIVSVSHNAASTENNSNILTTTSQCFSISNEQIQTALFVSQDDSTWFGHSIAAQLRLMPLHIKELAKMRIQQVIFECNSTSIASFQQFAQLQSKLVIPSIINDSLIQNISSEQNGNKQALEVNCEGEKIEENNEDVVDVVTVEEQKQKEINKSL